MFLARHNVRRHTPERNRQIVKALQVVIRKHRTIEQQTHRCSRVQSARQTEPMLQPELQAVRKCQLVFLATIAQRLKRNLSAKHARPVDLRNVLLDLARTISRGIQPSDQPSHARARDIIHRDMMRLQPLDNANVRKSKRSAALQRQPDLGSRLGNRLLCLWLCFSLTRWWRARGLRWRLLREDFDSREISRRSNQCQNCAAAESEVQHEITLSSQCSCHPGCCDSVRAGVALVRSQSYAGRLGVKPNRTSVGSSPGQNKSAPFEALSNSIRNHISKITGMINGLRLVLFWIYRFRSVLIFSLITP